MKYRSQAGRRDNQANPERTYVLGIQTLTALKKAYWKAHITMTRTVSKVLLLENVTLVLWRSLRVWRCVVHRRVVRPASVFLSTVTCLWRTKGTRRENLFGKAPFQQRHLTIYVQLETKSSKTPSMPPGWDKYGELLCYALWFGNWTVQKDYVRRPISFLVSAGDRIYNLKSVFQPRSSE